MAHVIKFIIIKTSTDIHWQCHNTVATRFYFNSRALANNYAITKFKAKFTKSKSILVNKYNDMYSVIEIKSYSTK